MGTEFGCQNMEAQTAPPIANKATSYLLLDERHAQRLARLREPHGVLEADARVAAAGRGQHEALAVDVRQARLEPANTNA